MMLTQLVSFKFKFIFQIVQEKLITVEYVFVFLILILVALPLEMLMSFYEAK